MSEKRTETYISAEYTKEAIQTFSTIKQLSVLTQRDLLLMLHGANLAKVIEKTIVQSKK